MQHPNVLVACGREKGGSTAENRNHILSVSTPIGHLNHEETYILPREYSEAHCRRNGGSIRKGLCWSMQLSFLSPHVLIPQDI